METDLVKAISAIHRSDSLDTFKSAFLGHVSSALQAEVFGLYLLNPRLMRISTNFLGAGAPGAFLREYESYRALDPIYDFVVRERCVADGANLLGTRQWRFHPLRVWLRKWGWQHSLQGPLVIKGEVAGTVNFARGSTCGAFTARSRWVAQVLCEEVSAVLERLLQNRETIAQLDLYESCFESAPMPLVISDRTGAVRAVNRHARSFATSTPGESRVGNPLSRVTEMVAEMARSSGEPLAVRTDSGDTFMSVRLRGCENLFLCAWLRPGDEAHMLEMLPERSRQVAELLIQGRQNKWIAWKLGISRDTVKYHVKRVYSLLGVSSRMQLLRLATARDRPL